MDRHGSIHQSYNQVAERDECEAQHKGKHKRNITMDPYSSIIRGLEAGLPHRVCRVPTALGAKKPGLTRETVLALRQTCLALAD